MFIDLTPAMMHSLDISADFNPPEVLQQIGSYLSQDFSAQDWNRLKYFKAKALFTMQRMAEAEEIALECIRESIVGKDAYTMVKCHVLQALCYYRTEAEDRIRPLLELAVEYAVNSLDYELMIHANSSNLYYLRYRSQFDLAFKEVLKIIDLIKRVPPSYTTACAFNTIAPLYSDMAKWDTTIRYYMQALEHAQSLSLHSLQLSVLNNLGSAICRVNDFPRAEKILQQGLILSQELGYLKQTILFTSNLGNMKIQDSKHQEAIEYYDKCLALLENIPQKPPMLMIDIYNNYSMCYWKLNQAELSLSYIDKAIKIASDCGFERDQIQIEINKTNLLVELGSFDEAISIMKRGVKYYRKVKDLHQLMWVYRSLSRVYFLKKEHKLSYETNLKLYDVTEEYIAEIQRNKAKMDMACIKVKDVPTPEYPSPNQTKAKIDQSHGFVGCSKASHNVLNSALLAAQHQNTSVLILGESGTGKEIIAQIIHKNSLRRNQAFVPVNLGALTTSLVESELFGHTKGAYTGADTPTKGFFLQADKGTLFLDEISDMPLPVQSKLLRALETRKVTAVGSSKEIPYDSRVISATSQDIRSQLSANQFRLDLFHRLNTIEIIIPPLRDRQEDIEPIFGHYVKHYSTELNKMIPVIDRSLIDMLSVYSFPGNVRELKNIVERMFILSKKTTWDAQILCDINPFSFAQDAVIPQAEDNEEDIILKALIKAKGKQKEAALMLNMSEATLYRRILKYQLQQYTRKNSK